MYRHSLRKQRIVALALSAAWCIISASIGLNSLIKSNQTQTRFRKLAPAGVTLQFHINDVYQSGVVITSICATLAVLSTIFLLVTIVWPNRATASLKIQAWMFTFFSVWVLAAQIPYTAFVATRRAKVDAFLGGVQLPAETVQAALAAAGGSDKYSSQHPVVLLAIFPWITLVFTTALIVVLFMAARKRVPLETSSQIPMSEGEKADIKT